MVQPTVSKSDSPYVLALSDLTPDQVNRVGAKAANLGELLRAGFPVPAGFVLTTQAFERFLREAGSSTQELEDATLPPELEASLRRLLAEFGGDPMAVRSSAVAEDLPGASYAGQYETVLDVRGFEGLAGAVRRCWASAFSERVADYQLAKGQDHNGGMAVLVQRMVQADAAGVAFSANPVTGDRGECVVNAVRGLGERLVSGRATPDEWVARGNNVQSRNVSEGAINVSQARAVVELARRVESHFGTPQDIEWAITNGEIFLLQARPITALPGASDQETRAFPHIADPSASDLTWEWDDEHSAVPMFPLLGDAVNPVWTGGSAHRARWLNIPYVVEYRVVHGYAYYTEHFLEANRDKVVEQVKQAKRAHARVLREYWDHEVWPAYSETYEWMRNLPVATAPLSDVAKAWDSFWERSPRLMGLHYMISTVVHQVLDDLVELYVSLFGGASPSEAMTLLQGSSNELHRATHDLFDLAEAARASTTVTGLILEDADLALTTLMETAEGRGFIDRLNAFLRLHGHLGQLSIDIMSPSWADEPARVLIELRKQWIHKGEDPEQRRMRIVAQAEALASHARERLRGRPDDQQRFENALALAQSVAPFKEDHNYWLDRMLQAHTHRFVMKVGERCVAANVLAAPQDIVFLHIKEVSDALKQPRDLRGLVSRRTAHYAQWKSTTPPRYLGKLPEASVSAPAIESNEQPGTGDVVRGMGACAGKVTGPARVVHSTEDFGRVQPGDVLVCASPNPSWVALYAIVAGLVTDSGGVLSHAAVLAREFGVPAVVGTGDATRRLRDGELVEIDGATGRVRLV
ncbi:MAG: PEP/pyruvate-binding domain-containing protein [Chloroflexota bacterium]